MGSTAVLKPWRKVVNQHKGSFEVWKVINILCLMTNTWLTSCLSVSRSTSWFVATSSGNIHLKPIQRTTYKILLMSFLVPGKVKLNQLTFVVISISIGIFFMTYLWGLFISVNEMTRLILPQMVERKKGAVINLSSLSAAMCTPLLSVYSGTKAYVDKWDQIPLRLGLLVLVTMEPCWKFENAMIRCWLSNTSDLYSLGL